MGRSETHTYTHVKSWFREVALFFSALLGRFGPYDHPATLPQGYMQRCRRRVKFAPQLSIPCNDERQKCVTKVTLGDRIFVHHFDDLMKVFQTGIELGGKLLSFLYSADFTSATKEAPSA